MGVYASIYLPQGLFSTFQWWIEGNAFNRGATQKNLVGTEINLELAPPTAGPTVVCRVGFLLGPFKLIVNTGSLIGILAGLFWITRILYEHGDGDFPKRHCLTEAFKAQIGSY